VMSFWGLTEYPIAHHREAAWVGIGHGWDFSEVRVYLLCVVMATTGISISFTVSSLSVHRMG
jgi:hypothetical protein